MIDNEFGLDLTDGQPVPPEEQLLTLIEIHLPTRTKEQDQALNVLMKGLKVPTKAEKNEAFERTMIREGHYTLHGKYFTGLKLVARDQGLNSRALEHRIYKGMTLLDAVNQLHRERRVEEIGNWVIADSFADTFMCKCGSSTRVTRGRAKKGGSCGQKTCTVKIQRRFPYSQTYLIGKGLTHKYHLPAYKRHWLNAHKNGTPWLDPLEWIQKVKPQHLGYGKYKYFDAELQFKRVLPRKKRGSI